MSTYKKPKSNDKYSWTNHSVGKMTHYRISESLVKRVVRFPKRVETGVAPGTTACMQPSGSKKHPTEIWVMYRPAPEVEQAFGKQGQVLKGTLPKVLDVKDKFNIGTGKEGTRDKVINFNPDIANLKLIQPLQSDNQETVTRGRSSMQGINIGTGTSKKIIISAWRYPGVSKVGEPIPIPEEILDELTVN